MVAERTAETDSLDPQGIRGLFAGAGFYHQYFQALDRRIQSMVAQAWAEFQEQYRADSLPQDEKAVFLSELAKWAGRLDAIANGALGVDLIIAYKS